MPTSLLSPEIAAQDRGPSLRRVHISMIVLSTVFVAVRFWSRLLPSIPRSSGKPAPRLWWDDWTCLIGWALSTATISLGFKMINLGIGRHIEMLQFQQIADSLKIMFAIYWTFELGTAVSKSSALFFYARIFGNANARLRYALLTIHILNAVWLVGNTFAILFQCDPIAKSWNPTLDGKCGIPLGNLWLGTVITSIVVDLMILILPLPMLWGLQMKLKKKLLVIGVFICAYGVIIVSLGQVIATIKSARDFEKDFSYAAVVPCYWMVTEVAATVISTSLPTIYTFVKRGYFEGPASLFGIAASSRAGENRSSRDAGNFGRRGHVAQLASHSTLKLLGIKGDYRVNAIGGSSLSSLTMHGASDMTNHAIHVRRDFHLNETATV